MKSTLLVIASFLVVAVLWLAPLAYGQAHNRPAGTHHPAATTTDAAGRTHIRPRGRISDAQRRASAQHRKQVRNNSVRAVRKNGGRP
jgi:hypothetical protein